MIIKIIKKIIAIILFWRKRIKERLRVKRKEIKEEKKIKEEKPKELGKSFIAYRIIKRPLITEKTTILGKQRKYLFEVFLDANKKEIKKAIEDLYKTKVEKVNLIKISAKRRRRGRQEGFKRGLKRGFKKAIITLKEGEKIEIE